MGFEPTSNVYMRVYVLMCVNGGGKFINDGVIFPQTIILPHNRERNYGRI